MAQPGEPQAEEHALCISFVRDGHAGPENVENAQMRLTASELADQSQESLLKRVSKKYGIAEGTFT